MSNLRRRVSFGDASSSTRPFHMDSAEDKELDKRNGSKRKMLVSRARKVGDYMFKSGLTIPAHASFGTPSFLPDTSTHLSTTIVTSKSHLSNLDSTNYSTLSFSMPRIDNFQGLPTPMFSADAYYFAPNTNPTAKRTKKSKPRSSVSSETASTTQGASNGTRSNDDIIGSLYSQIPTSLARANSTIADTTRRSGTSPKKRPSTANPSTNVQLPVASTSLGDPVPAISLPAISAEGTKPANLAPESTKMMSKPSGYKLKNGKRHHPYASSKAPYPRSYESTAIDHDTANHIFCQQLSKSVTWHEFATPPANVLDLGCGNGVWVLDAAKSWPHSHFVGLDLMPIQPNLSLVAPALKDRIEWCISNFLERLPFDDNYFDFIHIRRIARGVPENKWPLVLEEVARVLKPEGALEVVEEDLIFPGGLEPCTCHYPPDVAPPDDIDDLTPQQNDITSFHGHGHGHLEGSPPGTPVPIGPLKTNTTHPFYYSSPAVNSRDHSKLEEVYNDMHSSKFINLKPISVLTETLAHYFKDVRSHPPVLITFPPPEEEMWSDGSASGFDGGTSSDSTPAERIVPTRRHTKSRPSTTASSSIGSSGGSPTLSSQALSMSSMSPISPTDGRPSISSVVTSTTEAGSLFSLGPDPDENAAAAASAAGYMTHPPVGGWHTLHLDVRSLVHPRQPFIMIDRCRMPARGYGIPSSLPTTTTGDDTAASRAGHGYVPMTRLPNTTFELDLQNLTLLLSQSVTDVLECSEAMWEYLVDQGKARTKKPRANMHSHSLSYGPAGNSTSTVQSSAQGVIDREEFDHWISKYEKEMHTRIGMAEALRRRFGWETKCLTSDYVTTRAVPLPTIISPTSATQQRPLLVDNNHPSPDEMLGINNRAAVQSSSSTSLLASSGDGHGHNEPSGVMRQRTGSAPERLSAEQRKAGKHHATRGSQGGGSGGHSQSSLHGHGRAHSLDAANAWEALIGTAGEGEGVVGQRDGHHGETGLEVELPRLSRCIRVFVAWNGKE